MVPASVQPTRRQLLAGAASVAAAASLGCEAGGPAARPGRHAAGVGAGRAHDGPNVVLIVIDTLRADHAFGDRARTPNIDALARAGLSFTRVHPEAMPTVPARNSILSGRRMFPFRGWHPHEGLPGYPGWEPLERLPESFTSVLRRAGYRTAYVTDNPFLGFARPYEPFRRSLHELTRRGGQVGGRATGVTRRERRHWMPHWLASHPELRLRTLRYLANAKYETDESRSFSARVFGSAAEQLRSAAAGDRRRPLALVVDVFEPHEPWTPPRRYVDLYGDPDYRGVEPIRQLNLPVDRYLPEEERELMLERMRALYAAEVTLTDRWLGVFMEQLHDLGLAAETVVALVSDHGFLLGEHGLTGKLHEYLHGELTHVPLVIVDPRGRGAGQRTAYRASTHDLAPTLLSLAGVPVPDYMDGADLARLFERGEAGRGLPERPHSIGGYSDSFFVRTDDWALHGLNSQAGFRLYDLHADPGETRDLAHARPDVVRALAGVVEKRFGRLPFFGAV